MPLTVAILSAITYWLRGQQQQLQRHTFTSGYLLLGAVVFLALFQFRKQLAALPLGPTAWWMQAHIYVGLGCCWVLGLHIDFRWPNGPFESALFMLFAATTLSGLWGLWMTRVYPQRLAKLRNEYIYERIRGLRERVREQAGVLVMSLLQQQPAPTVGDFYTNRLAAFFDRPRGLWYAVRPSSRLRNRLRAEMDDLDRYFSPEERRVSDELRQLIDKRDDLDYHEALQRQLKSWLFVHISLTYALLIFAAIHTLMVHAFYGGAS